MFTKDDLHELAAFESQVPILSTYLDVDPTRHTKGECRLALKQLLKRVEGSATPEDVAEVERFFDHGYDWSGRGVAVFSCVEEAFWRSYPLAAPVASRVAVARKPYVGPLAALVETYGNYLVALVDRQGIRLSLFAMGEIQLSDEHVGEEVRKLKKGRGSSGGPGRRGGAPVSSRHEEGIAERNIREAVKMVKQFWRQHEPQHLVLAGAGPTVARFREALPKRLQGTVIGTFNADANAAETEMRERSLQILQQVEREREEALVEAVFTAAAKGRGGVIRLADTLSAAHEGRVQVLVVADGFRQPGYQCANCAYITDQHLRTCPFCGSDFTEIPDAAEALVARIIEDGGRVEVVSDHPRIAEFGVGALLRY